MKKRRQPSSTNRRKSASTQTAADSIYQDVNFPQGIPLPDPYEPTRNFQRAILDPKSFGEALRGQLLALWYTALRAPAESVPKDASLASIPDLWRKVRLELLKTAIHACNLLSHFDEEEFKDLALSEQGWPVVLAATRERAGDWKRARAKIKRLRAGMSHHSRLIPEPDTKLGEFLDFWTWRAMPELHDRAPSAEELKTLPQRAVAKLASVKLLKEVRPVQWQYVAAGEEWQDHPDVTVIFGKYKRLVRVSPVRNVMKQWEDWERYQKRDFIKDKFEAYARTLRERLKRFGRI
jgi:hypothetical protein